MCLYMAVYGRVMGFYGCVWLHMVVYGWCMVVYGCTVDPEKEVSSQPL